MFVENTGIDKQEYYIPIQLPPGFTEKEIREVAGNASKAGLVIMFVQLALQLIVKGKLDNMMTLFLNLQIFSAIS